MDYELNSLNLLAIGVNSIIIYFVCGFFIPATNVTYIDDYQPSVTWFDIYLGIILGMAMISTIMCAASLGTSSSIGMKLMIAPLTMFVMLVLAGLLLVG